ncbi:MAG TPA: hypothetical protein PLB05_07060 [Candidatus Omnitrophota bacterium]|nr:hypothetical protein [Candidatus Omnitrophota bacterium]
MRRAFLTVLAFFSLTVACAQAVDLPSWHGFVEQAYGGRVSRDSLTKHQNYNMLEQRWQLKTRYRIPGENALSRWNGVLTYKGDFLLDEYFGASGSYEVRECHVAFSPAGAVDIKAGRQVLTWGTGDYLFINDLFPKDYVSFYIGRDDEYLKKPSDALRVSAYPKIANIDFVVIPHFTPNTMPEGDRLSFFDSFQGGIAGRESDRNAVKPALQAENMQYALRVYRTFGSMEGALYYYRGFDPSPRSYLDEANRQLFYERLDAYGASVRSPFAGGISHAEVGYYRSRQDPNGTNRLVENSMFKGMVGYEKDLGHDLKVGGQYLYEQKLDYAEYQAALLPYDYFWDERRHLLTQRITKLYKNQTVMLGLFNFWSPSDRDGYARASCAYDMSDQWKLVVGVNIPWGEDMITDFGMMAKNKNAFVRVRYSF